MKKSILINYSFVLISFINFIFSSKVKFSLITEQIIINCSLEIEVLYFCNKSNKGFKNLKLFCFKPFIFK
jgi:hypothetical protein